MDPKTIIIISLIVITFISTCFSVAILLLFIHSRKLSQRNQALDEELNSAKALRRQMRESEEQLSEQNAELKVKLDEADEKVRKLEKLIQNLRDKMNMDPFDGRFPICAQCKDIRDDKGYWHPIEEYLQGLSDTDFSHSLCPECAKKLYPDLFGDENKAVTLTWK